MTAFAARTRPGPPENGRYQRGDTVPDSAGTVWECVKGGMAGGDQAFTAGAAVFVANPYGDNLTTFGVGATTGATVSAVEYGSGSYHKTVLTLAATPQSILDATSWKGTKIYTFPVGRILLLGCIATLAPTTTSTIASTIKSGVAGAVALGSVAADSISLTSTEVDMLPSTATVNSTVINVAAAAVTAALAAAAQFDGTTTAIDMYLNSSVAAADIDGNGTLTWAGTITFTWVNLGDY